MGLQKKNEKLITYFMALLVMVILSAIFVNSFYWPYEEISKRKVVVGAIVFFLIVVIPVLIVKVDIFYKCVKGVGQCIKTNMKKIIILLVFLLLLVGAAEITTHAVCGLITETAYNVRMFYLIITIFALVFVFLALWKNAARKPENVFVLVALVLGLFCIGVTPDKVGVSWDDQIHYERTLEISNYLNGIMYDSDIKNINVYVYKNTIGYDRQTDYEYIEDVETSYNAKEWRLHSFSKYGVWSVSYIPGAVGIILGRGLGLSYRGVFNLGRFMNLVTYVSLIYFAIKRIKYGKVLIAAIGLIPTTLFMASCYTYDSWVTGFTILGFSYFFAELQEDTLLSNRNIFVMVGAIVLGCLPKAIYFPLLFPLLFMPKKKFQSSKQRKIYYGVIVGMGLVLVATFLLPRLINGAGTGDARGGLEVNSTEQIKFILENPLAYLKILLRFLRDYISLPSSSVMLQFYAYAGNGHFYSIISIILIVLAFLDRGENEKNHMLVKGAGVIGCAAAVVLSTTALYISFTAVASGTVAGMQGRYLIPIFYPMLYSIGVGGTTHKINKNAFVCVPILINAITFLYNLSSFCVLNY